MSAGGYQEWIEGNQRYLSAALEQDLRESAGRSPGIEADAALGIEGEMIERSGKLHASARDVRMRRRRRKVRVDCDLFRGLAHEGVVGGDTPGCDRCLRLGATVEQAALDQQPVGAQAGRCVHRVPVIGTMFRV